jgi:hypothetical protein
MATLALRCRCGQVRGELVDGDPSRACHVVCYCDDCRAFNRWLGGDGLLDEAGGSEIVQTTPANVRITSGAEHLAAMRLTDRGMVRWYAGCCRTPIGNLMPWRRPPFVGLSAHFVDVSPLERDTALGPLLGQVQTAFATGPVPSRPGTSLFRTIRRSAWLVGRSIWTGAATPSPFRTPDGADGVAAARVLSTGERDALRALDGPR